jgi:hypothetical protein
MFGEPIFSTALADATYLRLDTNNDPLTGTLNAQSIVPNTNLLYDLGSDTLRWRYTYGHFPRFSYTAGLGSEAVTVGAFDALGGVQARTSNATASASITASGGGFTYMAGALALATGAGDTATIELLSTSGINFGSALTLLGVAPVAALVRLDATSHASVNFGSALPEANSSASIIIGGAGTINFGNVRGTGGTITVSGDSSVNFGTLLGGTLTISGPSSFNLGTVEAAGSVVISGEGSYNLAHVDAGILTLSGSDCINLGAVNDSGSTVTMAGATSQNFMAVSTGADVSMPAGVDSAFARGLATGSSTVTLSADGTSIQGLFLGRAATNITASGLGAAIIGTVDCTTASSTPGTVTMQATNTGSIAFGAIVPAAGGTGAATMTSSGAGSIVLGSVNLNSANAGTMTASGVGSLAGGQVFAGTLQCTGVGSFTYGYVDGATSNLQAASSGAFVHGRVSSGDGNTIIASSVALGAFAGGAATSATATTMTASGVGSFAHGRAQSGNAMTASGSGSFVHGDSAGGTIVASATNTAQFGPGTNNVATSLQVGNSSSGTGMWLMGGGAPGSPVDGQIWKASSIVNVRSNGQTIVLNRQGAYTQTYATADKTVAARATGAALTDNTGGTANTTVATIAALTAVSLTGNAGGTGNTAMVAVPDPADTPVTADALRDDLVANVLPVIRDDLDDLRTQLNAMIADWTAARAVILDDFADLALRANELRTDGLDTVEAVNAIIDDLQAINLVA